ncbi:TMEM17 [Lepeophtheirus salmonis]|uniref:TMEM17 n=1 Tax=Lepeophtheirus salmonis TaxID=72036 RepID=A0A7R8CZC3_LEPSM|nr:TMEM17 [Lepeophtheirus salmonis]CAF2974721.1 TMEM17 [Lepeophtheirus salmonis]
MQSCSWLFFLLLFLSIGAILSVSSPIDILEEEELLEEETSGGNEYYDDDEDHHVVTGKKDEPAQKRSLSFEERKRKYLSMSPEERKKFLDKVRRFRENKLKRSQASASVSTTTTAPEDVQMTLHEEKEVVDSLYGLPEEIKAEILEKERQQVVKGGAPKRDKKERRKLRKRKEFRKLFREFMEWQEVRERRRRQRRRRRRKNKKKQRGRLNQNGNARRRNANLLKETIENLMRLSSVEEEEPLSSSKSFDSIWAILEIYKKKVPELAGFWLLSIILQLPLQGFLLLNEDLIILPIERAGNIVMILLLISQLLAGLLALKRITRHQAKKFHLHQFQLDKE